MEIVRIFGADKSADGIWSIHLDGKLKNEYDHFRDLISDKQWLRNFFTRNESDLMSGFFGKITTGRAGVLAKMEMRELAAVLYDYFDQGLRSGEVNLQHLFKPLNNLEATISVHQKSKARIRRGCTRIYAIRLGENCYIVTGGAIKLNADMNRHHLQYELRKLERTRHFLKENGIIFPEDLNNFL